MLQPAQLHDDFKWVLLLLLLLLLLLQQDKLLLSLLLLLLLPPPLPLAAADWPVLLPVRLLAGLAAVPAG
jgi:hypothetical protein